MSSDNREVRQGQKRKSAAGADKNRSGKRSVNKQGTNRRQTTQSNNKNIILILILSIVVVISTIAGVVVKVDTNTKEPAVTAQGGDQDEKLAVEENDDTLSQDKYPEVNELIAKYRKAFLEGDTVLLKEVYNSDQEVNGDILQATSQIIQAYNNTSCYTKRGMNTGEYVVYVYDDLQLAGIKTLAPNLSIFYLKQADGGKLYIYRGDYNPTSGTFAYDAQTQAFIDEMNEDEEVNKLITEVNKLMDSACANDSDLMEFMQKVRSKTASMTSAAEGTGSADTAAGETTETTGESETETDTEAVDE